MALTRLKKLIATSAVAAAASGGASTALAQREASATAADVPSAQQRATAVRAEPRMADAAVWWRGQADWLERHRAVFEDALG